MYWNWKASDTIPLPPERRNSSNYLVAIVQRRVDDTTKLPSFSRTRTTRILLLTVVRAVGAVVLEHGIYRFVAFPRSSVWTGNTA